MNAKERLKKVIAGEKCDRPPLICPGGMMNPVVEELMQRYDTLWPAAHCDAEKMARLARAVVEEKLFDNYGVPFCMTVEAEAMGAAVDLGHSLAEPHVVGYAIDSLDQIDELRPIDLTAGRAAVVLKAIEILRNDEIPLVGNVPGPVSIASSVIDPSRFYISLRKNQAKAHELLNFIACEAGRFAKAQAAAGADLITISDPSGTAEILGPKYFKEFMIPYLGQMIAVIKEAGEIPVILHICGKMQKVFEMLPEIPADVFSFDAVVSLDQAEKYISKPVMGNISTYAIEHGDPERLRKLALNRLKRGTAIIAPACGLSLASPLANIKGILEGIEGEKGAENA